MADANKDTEVPELGQIHRCQDCGSTFLDKDISPIEVFYYNLPLSVFFIAIPNRTEPTRASDQRAPDSL